MPKEKNNKYTQKYVKNWENDPAFKGWLQPCSGDSAKAICTVCTTTIIAHKKTLLEHAQSKKHRQSCEAKSMVQKLPKIDSFVKVTLSVKRKTAELKIASYVAEHCSIKSVDHLSTLIKNLDDESRVLQDIKLHRTKCSALIKNVLSPCILEDLLQDIDDAFFSLIIDESTTVDTKKVLCLMVRYFSKAKRKIVTNFYRLIEIEAGTADVIAHAILRQLKNDGLDNARLLGIGVDGASVNVGARHSVSTILREKNPDLVVITCICHSLHLAAEGACKALPRHLDFLVQETHSWFSHSTKRQIKYRQIYETITGKKPKKIVQMSNTRWLVRLYAVDAILEQWEELKLHFRISESEERCYRASQLHSMFSTPENKLFLIFLSSTLKNVMAVNKLFQSDNVDPVKLFTDVNNLLYSQLQILVVPLRLQKVSRYELAAFDFQQHLMSLQCVNFGYEFNLQATTIKIKPESVLSVKERCRSFLVILCLELQKRLPDNIKILEQLTLFSPQTASCQMKSEIVEIATKFKTNLCNDIDSTVREWNLLHTETNADCSSTEKYWVDVHAVKDAGGNRRFENISKLAFGLMSLPFSNASVERAFSIMSIVKDKIRNKLSVPMVEAIMHVRITLGVDCCDFEPTPNMLKRFNSENVYSNVTGDDVGILDIFSITNDDVEI